LVDALRLFELDPRARRCSVKHAILLSDGDAPPADYEAIVRRMAEDGITVSTVCVSGAKFDAVLMSKIASWGKGRFKFTNSFENVPQLILNETQKVLATVPRDDKKPAPTPALKVPLPLPPTENPPPDPRPYPRQPRGPAQHPADRSLRPGRRPDRDRRDRQGRPAAPSDRARCPGRGPGDPAPRPPRPDAPVPPAAGRRQEARAGLD